MSDYGAVKNLEGSSIKLTMNFKHNGTMSFYGEYMEFAPSKLNNLMNLGMGQKNILFPYNILKEAKLGRAENNPLFKVIKIYYPYGAFSGGYGDHIELFKYGNEGKRELGEIMEFINKKIELLKEDQNKQDAVVQSDDETQVSTVENGAEEKCTENVSESLPLFCPKCGTKFEEGAGFCSKCGNKR